MLTLEEALARCLALSLPRHTLYVPLAEAYGRVLASDLRAPSPLPPWDNAAMDGFAIRYADCRPPAEAAEQSDCDLGPPDALPPVVARLAVVETIAAGQVGQRVLGPGQAARIMTGAPLPEGADVVVMRENTSLPEGSAAVFVHGMPRPGQHIRRAGEEFAPGALVLSAGTELTPAAVGLLAALGLTEVEIVRPPRVGLLSTGDELVLAGQHREHGQIWSSNADTLAGLVREAGGEPVDCGIAPDTREGTVAALQRARRSGCEVLLTTGGVSVGDFDMVKEALSEAGAEMLFWKVRLKPGKPLALGRIGEVPVFGLPGNPVSAAMNFLQFVRPVLRRALGDPRPFLPALRATLRTPGGYRRRPGRAELVRVRLAIEDGRLYADLTGTQSSAWISSVALADGLLLLGTGSEGVQPGEEVWVQPLRGGGVPLLGDAGLPLVIPGFVLAGGRSRRMGRDKALLPVGPEGTPLALRTARTLERAGCHPVSVVGNQPALASLGRPVIPDAAPPEDRHPLWGVAAALASAGGPLALLCPCDLVDLTAEAVGALLAVGGPCVARGQPLLCVLHREDADRAQQRARLGGAVRDFVADLPVVILPPEALRNVNGPGDL